MKIAFFGTPDFAVPSLERLHYGGKHKVVCVVTQPDRAGGRGGKVVNGAVKQFALDNGIPVLQPERINSELHILDKFKPEVIVTCAFGQFLNQSVLDYCKHGVINVHASLLPKYRGSSPIQWAIIKGETRTGISIMQTNIGMDTGDIILQKTLDIKNEETSGELFARLSELGAVALHEALGQIEDGEAERTPQNGSEATVFPMLKKETGRIQWTQTAADINNLIRGLNPWPMAFFVVGDSTVRVFKATPFSLREAGALLSGVGIKSNIKAGTVLHADSRQGLFVSCGEGVLRLDILQAAGSRAMTAKEFLNGHKLEVNSVLSF